MSELHKTNLKGRDFLTLKDFDTDEILQLVNLVLSSKHCKRQAFHIHHWREKHWQ